ncbi:hypothetical protein S7711_00884 [Stachybotrys chartarum IBT 7711]|uniref:DUF1746 domain-containing protein n=1 Tax=Stachybotrys chartarum (strain CBS 109288 / IBT 7711) TaxID=1280523 RepID=A0A084B0I1_STACB|nr:hypothetical protein S7711_00884 [Stachybotrys chartarum IBT 7711]KFA50156.1 hypothetical protein S40293_03684 [Stachybotrys chartarum IBT 40293]KFA72604.1 hypothetical protein S40288_08792 [Stachybotrys chartarum IBT 40288]
MNHDPSPSSTAHQPHDPAPDHVPREPSPDRDADSPSGSPLNAAGRRLRRRAKSSRRRRKPGLLKKLAFTTHLLKTLDLVVFAELSGLYYMECSTFRFLLRASVQFLCFSPKGDDFPFFAPASRLHIFLILISNLVCLLSHTFGSLPTGHDYHRGYQHGGLIIDFVGQKPPAWRVYYVIVDIVIVLLQCLILSAHTDRENLRVALGTFRPHVHGSTAPRPATRTVEELDAEERGQPQESALSLINETGDMELRALNASSSERSAGAMVDETDRYRNGSPSESSSSSHLDDILSSGNAIIGEYNISGIMRSAALAPESASASSLRSIGYETTMAALQTRRRAVNNNMILEAQNR